MSTPGYTHAHIKAFIQHNYRHFNAASVVDAAQGWVDHLGSGGKMFFTMAGAMSTAELGVSLAEMIRQDKIAAITCTGANLEEDVYNLVAHNHYKRVPHYRSLSTEDEVALWLKKTNEGVKALKAAIEMEPGGMPASFARALLEAHEAGTLTK